MNEDHKQEKEHEHHTSDKKEHKHKEVHVKHHANKSHEIKNRIKKKLLKARRDKTIFLTTTIIFLILFVGILIFKPYCPVTNENTSQNTEVTTTGLVATIINDVRCNDQSCDTTGLKASLQQLFPTVTFNELDYANDEAKQLMQEVEVTFLPALLFNSDIKSEANYAQVSDWVIEKGDYFELKIPAIFDPTAEICDNNIDDTGNGLVDCEDPTCSSELICNPDVISDCVADYGIDSETIIFYYSNSCGYCAKMKPVVEELETEGYSVKWIEGADPEGSSIISSCLAEHFESGGVPKFICPKTANIRTGAFLDAEGNGDKVKLQEFFDACIEE